MAKTKFKLIYLNLIWLIISNGKCNIREISKITISP